MVKPPLTPTAGLRTPPGTVLARAVSALPGPGGMPGGCRYEPKWDGFRAVVVHDTTVTIWSRRGTDMTGAFPELAEAAAAQLPDGVTLDGEIVAWVDGRLDFDALQHRLASGKQRRATLVRDTPASLAVFDLLTVVGRDIRSRPFDVRRALLEELAAGWEPPLSLSPVTRDAAEAARWMVDLAPAGLEGIVVKGGGQAYRPGERDWVKVKHRDTVDVIVGAVIGPRDRPQELVVGQYVDGVLRIVGRTTPLAPSVARTVGPLLRPPSGEHPWPEAVKPGALDRFGSRKDPVHLTLVEPVTAEVSADVARTGISFRHAVRFVRLRTDLH